MLTDPDPARAGAVLRVLAPANASFSFTIGATFAGNSAPNVRPAFRYRDRSVSVSRV
jgi:hypothetical protein